MGKFKILTKSTYFISKNTKTSHYYIEATNKKTTIVIMCQHANILINYQHH